MQDPYTGWERICSAANLEDVRIHDLRRTMGSWQAIAGVSLTVIGKSLGHKNASTTAIYARLSDSPVRAAVETAAEALLKRAAEKPG